MARAADSSRPRTTRRWSQERRATTGTCTFKTNTSNQLEADCPIKTPAGASNFTTFTNSSPTAGDFWMDTNFFKYYNGTTTRIFAFLDSPAFTGTPTVPTATPATNNTQAASTAYVDTGLALKAPLASPTFTGTPAAPTAAPGTNTTQLATTAFVAAAVTGSSAAPTFPVTSQTANYTVLAGDFSACKHITMSNAGATTVTLLGTAPAAGQCISVGNIGAGGVAVARNGLTIDGAASNVSLTTNQSVDIISDGTNYFTRRGIGGAGGSGLSTSDAFISVGAVPGDATNGRQIAVGSGIVATDAGAGSTYTIDTKNKTIDSQGPTGTLTGNSADQTIFTTTIAANALQAADMVTVNYSFKKLSGAATCTYKGFFGATSFTPTSSSLSNADATGGWSVYVNSTSAQSVRNLLSVGMSGSISTAYSASPAEATSGTIVVKLTANCANTETFQGQSWLVERKRP
jgi:hypothetical protein